MNVHVRAVVSRAATISSPLPGRVEDDDVAALRIRPGVREARHEHAVADVQRRLHRLRRDAVRLDDVGLERSTPPRARAARSGPARRNPPRGTMRRALGGAGRPAPSSGVQLSGGGWRRCVGVPPGGRRSAAETCLALLLADARLLADLLAQEVELRAAARRRSPAPRCLSIFGECTGNVRSTPTPNDCLRTVKVSRTPAPWRLMQMPSKTCTRWREPSITWKCTRTVSPALKSGTWRS